MKCALCAGSFICAQSASRMYCSLACAAKSRWVGHVRKYRNQRPQDKPVFLGPFSKIRPAKKCGHLTKKGRSFCAQCTSRHKRPTITCPVCGVVKAGHVSDIIRRVTCSQACYGKLVSERQRGSRSHLWRGGLVEEQMRLRGTAQYGEWRRAVFERDNYTCVKCLQRGGKLTADHIKPWALFPNLRFELANGRTMCWPCHRAYGVNPSQFPKSIRERLSSGVINAAEALALLP